MNPVRSFDHQERCDLPRTDEADVSQVRYPLRVRLLAWLIPTILVHTRPIPSSAVVACFSESVPPQAR